MAGLSCRDLSLAAALLRKVPPPPPRGRCRLSAPQPGLSALQADCGFLFGDGRCFFPLWDLGSSYNSARVSHHIPGELRENPFLVSKSNELLENHLLLRPKEQASLTRLPLALPPSGWEPGAGRRPPAGLRSSPRPTRRGTEGSPATLRDPRPQTDYDRCPMPLLAHQRVASRTPKPLAGPK